MLPLPDLQVCAGLIALFLVCLPLGAALLRVGERFLGRTVGLSPVERLLMSFYATGGLLYVVAALPVPLFGDLTVVAFLVAGGIGYAVLALRERGRGVRAVLGFLRGAPGILLGVGSLALLFLEVSSGSLVLPNGIDGSVYSLYVNRLLDLHTLPWTLQPYAADGVIYPQGATVWMALPVVLLGWPIVASPVALPPLFLSLGPAAAFCLGQRLAGPGRSERLWMGLVFAGFFGLVASWPRLYVGGSYDFILGLPLFLLVLGFVRPFVNVLSLGRETIAFGVLLGATAALSVTVGTALAALLLGQLLASSPSGRTHFVRRLGGVLASIGVAALFAIRSFVGMAVWWSYPGHVMTSNSVPPYPTAEFRPNYDALGSQIDPFSLWKWKVSPIPLLSLELQFLLVVGLVLAVLVLTRFRGSLARYLSRAVVEWTVVSTATLLLLTVLVGVVGELNTSLSGISSVTNLWELSILLFVFYSLVAILPLVAASNYLRSRPSKRAVTAGSSTPHSRSDLFARRRGQASGHPWVSVLAAAVIAVPLASGLVVTSTVVPGYLHTYLMGQSNGTEDDVLALEWAGDHLPSCSGVLVAPGSAAQFLPEYATLRIVYPVFPSPTNLTYYTIVSNLTKGSYGSTTRDGLIALGVTEVFVTGATTDTYRPFSAAPLRTSADFSLLFSSGDALIFAFTPGVDAEECPPT